MPKGSLRNTSFKLRNNTFEPYRRDAPVQENVLNRFLVIRKKCVTHAY